jgi:neutral trehalase
MSVQVLNETIQKIQLVPQPLLWSQLIISIVAVLTGLAFMALLVYFQSKLKMLRLKTYKLPDGRFRLVYSWNGFMLWDLTMKETFDTVEQLNERLAKLTTKTAW